MAEVEGWPDTEDTGRRLSDDCWTGPQGLAKKEESAVQQRRRKVPPFSDVSPATCGSRRKAALTSYQGHRGAVLPLARSFCRCQGH